MDTDVHCIGKFLGTLSTSIANHKNWADTGKVVSEEDVESIHKLIAAAEPVLNSGNTR